MGSFEEKKAYTEKSEEICILLCVEESTKCAKGIFKLVTTNKEHLPKARGSRQKICFKIDQNQL